MMKRLASTCFQFALIACLLPFVIPRDLWLHWYYKRFPTYGWRPKLRKSGAYQYDPVTRSFKIKVPP